MGKKLIPVGQDDFRKLIEKGYYFVDKSPFIKELIEKHDFVNLITRPRRFGKTLNMSMLQYFFEKEENNYEHLFRGLSIYEEKQIWDLHMGKYPVISLTFMNAKHDTWENAVLSLKHEISDEFKRHIDAVNAYPYNRERIEAIINANNDQTASYIDSIYFLSQILYNYYKKEVIILIDEYDVPLEAAYTGGYYELMLDFTRSLLRSALKSNKYLNFALLTGCLRIGKESVFTGLNNFSTFSLTDLTFSEFFGFLPEEVSEYLDYYDLNHNKDEIKSWYDGYSVKNSEIYNPWSVTKQIKRYVYEQGEPLSHWGNTSGNDIIKHLVARAQPSTKNEIECLLRGNTIEKPIAEDMTYIDLYERIDYIWSFLFYTGYLTADTISLRDGVQTAVLRIPNKEIEYIFINKIQEWFREVTAASEGHEILKYMISKDKDSLQALLNQLLFDTISYMDYNENYYHGFMTGLLAQTGLVLKSNRETGLGRADITLHDSQTAVIMELKVAEEQQKLERTCKEALKQIDAKKYISEFPNLHCIRVGIAFYKKSCVVMLL